ncbi:TetR/AcrR family transcriptional regulator [Paenibacillus taichungensis]|uniref:TetR/AcrR family transcriptional regulator n=1 Tax=Paenibacillus taichungensis TaxID=484184 RepID=UPI0028719C4D|nr:TetR/AcrR family transcriptional regulator C-terminal domain-containing protein [Paenibacillus taichungensis]MDR9747309.1 TetR/AcrR family transcriptional regulator C-terminal domain-containing protein [Paenibacillus taichungensis]
MKESRGVDRRILRTRVMISKALLKILPQKTFTEISVVDIAEQANINRSTFYAHFLDKDDLLDSMVNEKFQLLEQLLAERNSHLGSLPSFNEPDPIYAVLFEHILEHEEFYRVMVLINPAGNFNRRLNEVIREMFLDRISQLGMEQKEVPLDILLDHISFSTIGIIHKWLADNKVNSPHHMALQLTRIALLGTYKAMGALV